MRFAAAPKSSCPSPICEIGGTAAEPGLLTCIAGVRPVPRVPSNPDRLRPRNGNRKLGYLRLYLDEGGVRGLAGLATEKCGDEFSDVPPGSDTQEEAQPLRLGYASHALKLQGGQAAVVLVLPGGWQTSRQSAYSMATRCVEELRVFVDAETQQSGPYRDTDPVQALGARWTRDAGKLAATIQLDPYQPNERLGDPSANDSVLAVPHRSELARWAPELPGERDLTDGFSIDL